LRCAYIHLSSQTLNHATVRRRCTGCLKLQVSFCKRATNDRALLQKETHKDKAFCAFLPPFNSEIIEVCIYIYRIEKCEDLSDCGVHVFIRLRCGVYRSNAGVLYWYSLLHFECHLNLISDFNLIGLFTSERGKRDLEN